MYKDDNFSEGMPLLLVLFLESKKMINFVYFYKTVCKT